MEYKLGGYDETLGICLSCFPIQGHQKVTEETLLSNSLKKALAIALHKDDNSIEASNYRLMRLASVFE